MIIFGSLLDPPPPEVIARYLNSPLETKLKLESHYLEAKLKLGTNNLEAKLKLESNYLEANFDVLCCGFCLCRSFSQHYHKMSIGLNKVALCILYFYFWHNLSEKIALN